MGGVGDVLFIRQIMVPSEFLCVHDLHTHKPGVSYSEATEFGKKMEKDRMVKEEGATQKENITGNKRCSKEG